MGSVTSDPQFYVVTAVALGCLWMVVRPFLRRSDDQEAGCPTCTTCSVTRAPERAASDEPTAGLVTLGAGEGSSKRVSSGGA